MINLKTYLDAVNAAHDDAQQQAHIIDGLLKEGTEESKQMALGMRSALEEAQTRHADAVAMYELMQRACKPNEVAKNFVPVSLSAPSGVEAGSDAIIIKRSEYDAMLHSERYKFIRSGGKIED